MIEQATPSPSGNAPAPSANPAPSPPEFSGSSSFVRDRVRQMQERMQEPAPSDNAPAPEAREQQPPQQSPPGERMIRVGESDYSEQTVIDAITAHTEAQVRKTGLPSAPEGYEVRNSEGFQLPQGVSNFQFDMKDPTLAAARKFALDNNLTQQQFESMLDLHVASKAGELLNQVRAREANLAQLGAAGPQRIESIATWMSARAGKDGAQVGNFLRQFPSAPIVRAMETLIKQFSSQGGADFSQSHRTEQEQPGKIPGYDRMSFTEKRVHQMTQMLNRPGYRGGGGRRGE